MFSPLLETIIKRENLPVLSHDQLDAFLESHEETVLFISGDAARFPEANDVAVILPELIKVFQNRLSPAVIHYDSVRAVQKRFRFNKFPALIFNRGTGYLGAIPKVLDWGDYIREISTLLSQDVREIPGFELPEGCRSAVEDATTHPQNSTH